LVKAAPLNERDKPYRDFDFALGWSGMFSGGLDIVQAEGHHISMIEIDQHMARIAGAVNELLERDAAKQRSEPSRKAAVRKELSMAS
jgi:hypothetical protein